MLVMKKYLSLSIFKHCHSPPSTIIVVNTVANVSPFYLLTFLGNSEKIGGKGDIF